MTNSQPFDGTTYFYYNPKWQMLESRDGSENLDSQVIYGTQYVDEIVRFEKQGKATMFVFQDANWNVTSAVNYAGVPLDRVYTTPYGQPTFDTETINGDYDADGDIDSADNLNFDTCNAAADPPSGSCRVFDFDNDADIDAADETIFDTLYPGSTEITRQPARRTSANGLPFAHQGLALDPETLTYYNRGRQYNPRHGRFTQRDPLTAAPSAGAGLQDGMNVYQYEGANPPRSIDPSGEHVTSIDEHGVSVMIDMDLKFYGKWSGRFADQAAKGFDHAWNRTNPNSHVGPDVACIRRASQCNCKGVDFNVTSEIISAESASRDGPSPLPMLAWCEAFDGPRYINETYPSCSDALDNMCSSP